MVRLLFYIHDKEGMVIPTQISIKLRSRILTKLEQKKGIMGRDGKCGGCWLVGLVDHPHALAKARLRPPTMI